MYKYAKQGVCLFLILLTVGFIFFNSAQPVEASKERSANVAEILTPTPKEEYEQPADWRAFVAHVRKSAHAIEFFGLGLELVVLFFWAFPNKRIAQAVWNTVSVALTVAVADESIQILSGRGPKVQDVLLDFCGAVAAAAVSLLVFGIVHLYRKRRTEQNSTVLSHVQ